MTEREAFAQRRRELAAELQRQWRLKRLRREIANLEEQLQVMVARELVLTKAGRKAMHNFWGYTLHGWDMACDGDGRLKRLPRNMGWESFQKALEIARVMEVTPESEWIPAWRVP